MIGKKILGYTVIENIGAGTFGTVYKVQKTNPSGQYIRALKHIHIPTEEQYQDVLDYMGNNTVKADEYFANALRETVIEIQNMNQLSEQNSRNIVLCYENDIREYDYPRKYDIYILMEYLTPFSVYRKQNPVRVGDVIQLGTDILDALSLCHKNKILHRDIKDDNILVSSNGIYKLGDFGISKKLWDCSRARTIAGTLHYMAPEVYMSKEGYDYTADIYSLGIVLYKLLNYNRYPFYPKFPEAFAHEDEIRALDMRMKEIIPNIPQNADSSLGEVIVRALYPKGQRWSSAEEFRDALCSIQQQLGKEQNDRVVNSDVVRNFEQQVIVTSQSGQPEDKRESIWKGRQAYFFSVQLLEKVKNKKIPELKNVLYKIRIINGFLRNESDFGNGWLQVTESEREIRRELEKLHIALDNCVSSQIRSVDIQSMLESCENILAQIKIRAELNKD